MQPPLSIAEAQQREEALAYSRRLLACGISGVEQCAPLAKRFGYDGKTCQAVYEEMLDGVHQSIVEAKTNPYNFRAKRHRATRGNEQAPWSVRISAQAELDELFDLFEVAREPDGWENLNLLDAWNFYEQAVRSDTITQSQRHRVEKRMDLLMYGPKRLRNSSGERDRRDHDMTRRCEYVRTSASREPRPWSDPTPEDLAYLEDLPAASVESDDARADGHPDEDVARTPDPAGASPTRFDSTCEPQEPRCTAPSAFGIPHSHYLPPLPRQLRRRAWWPRNRRPRAPAALAW